MATTVLTTETPVTLRLSEQAVTRPSVDEVLAPFRKQVAESGMSDEELDAFFRSELEAHRREKRAKSAWAFPSSTTRWSSSRRHRAPIKLMQASERFKKIASD